MTLAVSSSDELLLQYVTVYTIEIEAIAEDGDIDLFCKIRKTIIALILYYPLLNLVHTSSDPKGTHMNFLGVIRKVICTPLPFSLYVTSICVLYSFVFVYCTTIVISELYMYV